MTNLPTGQDINVVWHIVEQVGGMFLVVVGLMKSWEYLHKRTSIAKLEATSKQHAEWLDNDYKKLQEMELKLDKTDAKVEEGKEISRLILNAMQELLRAKVGNDSNVEEIESVSKQIDEYLRSKI